MIDEALGLVHKYMQNAASSGRRNPIDTVIKRIGLVPSAGGASGSRAQFETPDFDLTEITAAYDTDSYVRQAIDKYTDLIFKAGWEITSSNNNAADYVRQRLEIMAEATQTPIEEFLNQIAEDLVKYGNVFIVKARLGGNYSFPNGVQVTPVGDRAPVVGYFVLPPETMQIARDKNGTVKKYQQKLGDKPVSFKPEDMIHITWKKRRGQAYGTPFLIPVLPDVRLLREIEDNINRLLHKYLHPLYKFHVGLEKDGFQSTPEELEFVREMVEQMPTDGTLVLPERYDVDVVGAQGEAINAEWALRYFEQRVFTGLGVPEIVFGRGSTANRSTADNLTSEMHDRVKAFQRVIASSIIHHIVNEILLEGGFDPVLNMDDQVQFKFLEIAIDEQIKLENQATFLYEHNAINFAEMRQRIGYEQEIDDESLMYINRVQIPLARYKVFDIGTAGDDETNNKQKPKNQHGTKTSPKKTSGYKQKHKLDESASEISQKLKINEFQKGLALRYENLRYDIIEINKSQEYNKDLIKQAPMVFDQTKSYIVAEFNKYGLFALKQGILRAKEDKQVTRAPNVNESLAARKTREDFTKSIDKLLEDLSSTINNYVQAPNATEKISSAFDVFKYRIGFIARSSLMKAYNYGYALSAKELGESEVHSFPSENSCDDCLSMVAKKISLDGDFYDRIPPWHTNCWCKLKIK